MAAYGKWAGKREKRQNQCNEGGGGGRRSDEVSQVGTVSLAICQVTSSGVLFCVNYFIYKKLFWVNISPFLLRTEVQYIVWRYCCVRRDKALSDTYFS
jgi:hypothetical protein